jgi:hypothetical protein
LNEASVQRAHFANEILDSEPTQHHLRFFLRVGPESKRLQFLIEQLSELDDVGLEDHTSHMACSATSCQQLVDDGRCELLWVATGVCEQISKLEDLSPVISDVLTRKGLWLEFFDLLLDPLDVLECVLLYDISHSEPIDGKELALLFIQSQSVNGLAQLLFE